MEGWFRDVRPYVCEKCGVWLYKNSARNTHANDTKNIVESCKKMDKITSSHVYRLETPSQPK